MNLVHHNSQLLSSSCQTPVLLERFSCHIRSLIYPTLRWCQEKLARFPPLSLVVWNLPPTLSLIQQFVYYSSMTLHWAWGYKYVAARWVRDRRWMESMVQNKRDRNEESKACNVQNNCLPKFSASLGTIMVPYSQLVTTPGSSAWKDLGGCVSSLVWSRDLANP